MYQSKKNKKLPTLTSIRPPEEAGSLSVGSKQFLPSASLTKRRGRGINEPVMAKMESYYGEDFSRVVIHTNSFSARKLGAKAYTKGDNIHFATGQFNQYTTAGQTLIGHELAHVVQQREGVVPPQFRIGNLVGNASQPLERQADIQGRRAARSASRPSVPGRRSASAAAGTVVQAKWTDEVANFASSVGDGVVSVGEDLVGGVRRTGRGLNIFDTAEGARIGAENERAYGVIVSLVRNESVIRKTVSIAIQDIYDKLPANKKEIVNDKLIEAGVRLGGYVTGRMIVGSAIARRIALKIAGRIASGQVYKMIAKKIGVSAGASATGIGIPIALLMLQGVLERAARASRKLARENPELYRELKKENLDMAWFLVASQYASIKKELLK